MPGECPIRKGRRTYTSRFDLATIALIADRGRRIPILVLILVLTLVALVLFPTITGRTVVVGTTQTAGRGNLKMIWAGGRTAEMCSEGR